MNIHIDDNRVISCHLCVRPMDQHHKMDPLTSSSLAKESIPAHGIFLHQVITSKGTAYEITESHITGRTFHVAKDR